MATVSGKWTTTNQIAIKTTGDLISYELQLEGVEPLYPGMLVKEQRFSKCTPYPELGTSAERLFCVENLYLGKLPGDVYAENERVMLRIFRRGDEIWFYRSPNSLDMPFGTYLTSDVGGGLIEIEAVTVTTGFMTPIAVCLENLPGVPDPTVGAWTHGRIL